MDTRERVIISLGGSLIAPNDVDAAFLSSFRNLILSFIGRGFSFAIATGGGKTCRKYQAAGKEVANLSKEEIDWVGIHVNNMHAEFLRILFGEHAAPNVLIGFEEAPSYTHPVLLVGSERPGHSSDYDAVMCAKLVGAKKVINLSNIEYAYDKDPNVYPDAKKIEQTNWKEFRGLLPTEWNPGLSSPFDPIAAKLAEELSLELAIIGGQNLSELEKCLRGESFLGTVVR
jgi:uridylate kinase